MTQCKQSVLYFLFVLLSLSIVLSACDQSSTIKKSTDPVQTWIQQNAITLKTAEPGTSDADLQFLQQSVGSTSIVGLGEATHGTHEVVLMKARLAEYLISHMNFHTFVVEEDWGSSQIIDDYINGSSNTLAQVAQGSLASIWQTQEFEAMLQWMRAYNTDAIHTTKIHFVGMDCQGSSQGDKRIVDEIEQYVQKVDTTQAAHVQELYLSIKKSVKNQAQQVYDLLKFHQQMYEQRSSAQEFALTLQNARVIVQNMTCYLAPVNKTYYIQRDAFMAENVMWIHDHMGESNPKLIVWAHNVHIANNTSYGKTPDLQETKNLGGFLRAKYAANYLPIGTSLYQGKYNMYSFTSTSWTVTATTLTEAGKESYNYKLASIGSPLYALDVRKTSSGPVSDWFNGNHVLLNQGVSGEDALLTGSLKQLFDIVVFLRNTTPTHSVLP